MLRTSTSIVVLFALHAACSAPPADISFRDLNKNGKLDVYEDVTQTVDGRIDDLLSQMSVAEKADLMFINIAIVNDDASLEYIPGSGPERWAPLRNIDERKLNHFNVGKIPDDPAVFAQWQNNLQRYAEMNTRLGADYGTSDRAVAEVLFGIAIPEGRLPFELPSSMEAVRNQYEDVPGDSESPLFESGFGLAYH
jgi:hypothetical protein